MLRMVKSFTEGSILMGGGGLTVSPDKRNKWMSLASDLLFALQDWRRKKDEEISETNRRMIENHSKQS